MTAAAALPVSGFAACGPLNGGFRVRLAGLAPELQSHGIELATHPLLDVPTASRFERAPLPAKLAIAARARRALVARLRAEPAPGTVVVHRQADLYPTWSVERALASGRRLIYDIDDAVWLNPAGPAARPLVAPRKLRWIAARADCVLAGNDHLAAALERYARNVLVVPSLVDPSPLPARRHAATEQHVVGWIGSPGNGVFLRPIMPALERVACAIAPRRLVLDVVGAACPPSATVEVRTTPWSLAAERAALARFDVGLMPLIDSPWTRGKCGYKALLYEAAGIPVVASDVTPTRAVMGDGGFAVRTPNEWVDALVTLLEDVALRARMGAAGRRHVESSFSPAAWGARIARALSGR